MVFEILKGIVFIFVCHNIITFFNPNKNPRFVMRHSVISFVVFFGGIALLPLISLAFFPLWFTVLCYGIFVMANLGVDTRAPAYSLSSFERKHGMMFNNIGMLLYVVAFALFVYQTFFS